MKQCWADILGGCSKQASREHYVGKGLFEDVTTHGLHPNLDGRSLSVNNLKANILCEKHNNRLSLADQEAINLQTTLDKLFRRKDNDFLKGDGLWTPAQYNVDGLLFGCWLCKLHCNFLTLKKIDPPEYHVRSAFGEQTNPSLRFYVRVQNDEPMTFQHRISYANFSGGPCKQDEYGTFHVFFMGFHFLVCPYDLTNLIKVKLADSTGNSFYMGDWMDKPQKIEMEQNGIVVESFIFNWGAKAP